MSHMSDVGMVIRTNYAYGVSSIDVPLDAQIVEIYCYPNGGSNEGSIIAMGMRFNSDTGSNYRHYRRRYSSGAYGYSSTTTATSIPIFYWQSGNTRSVSKTIIYPRRESANCYKSGRVEWYNGNYPSGYKYLQNMFWAWENTADSITTISFGGWVAGRHSHDMIVKFIK